MTLKSWQASAGTCLVIILAAIVTSCSSGGSSPPPPPVSRAVVPGNYLLLGDSNSELHAVAEDANGVPGAPTDVSLQALGTTLTFGGENSTHTYFYVLKRGTAAASIQVLQGFGPKLSFAFVAQTSLDPTSNPTSICMDPAAKFLYVSYYPNTIQKFSIDSASGLLTAGPTYTGDAPGTSPGGLMMTPSGKFLYASDGLGKILGYQVATDGTLAPVPGSPLAGPVGLALNGFAIDATGTYLFSVSSYGALYTTGVVGYEIDATTGALSLISGSPFAATDDPQFLYLAPAGYIYLSNLTNQTHMEGYKINADGSLTPVAGSPFTLPGNLPVLDASGKFLYFTTGGSGGSIAGYKVDAATGDLTAITGSPFAVGWSAGQPLISLKVQ